MEKINIQNKLGLFSDLWNPKIIGELNQQHVKLVKLKGEFIWHKHDNEDELFLVLKGSLKIEFRAKIVELNENEMFIVERSSDGNEYIPISQEITKSEVANKFYFIDNEPLVSSYYRLKIIEKGNVEYSQARYIELEKTDKFYIDNIYPIPSFDKLYIDVYSGDESNVTIEIIDLSSRKIFNENKIIQQGNSSLNLNISDYKKGIYFLIISDGNKTIRSKIIIK